MAKVFIQQKLGRQPPHQCHSLSAHAKKIHVIHSKLGVLLQKEWNGIDLPLLAMLFYCQLGFEKSIKDSCHRCFFHKLLWENDILQKWFTTLLSSPGKTKCASQPSQMGSRNALQLYHNSIKDHDIYRADLRSSLGKCTVQRYLSKVCAIEFVFFFFVLHQFSGVKLAGWVFKTGKIKRTELTHRVLSEWFTLHLSN